MFADALETARKLSSSKDNDLALPAECLPEKYTLKELYDEVLNGDEAEGKNDQLAKLLVLSRGLNGTEVTSKEDDIYVNKLVTWISQVMLPTSDLVPHDEMPEAPKSDARQLAILNAQHRGETGMRALMSVSETSPRAITSSPKTMISILAFTSSLDPWTTATSLTLAESLINVPALSHLICTDNFIFDDLISGFIYHLFSRSKPEGITAAGRKAMPSSAPKKAFDIHELEKASRPWKYDVPYSVTVFSWAIEHISPLAITQKFHYFVPPLLTLLDEISTPIRLRALVMLPTFFSTLNPKLLSQTGLGSVFEDALLPILLYLPTLTPLDESLQLVPAAYEALFALCSSRYSLTAPKQDTSTTLTTRLGNADTKTPNDTNSTSRLAFLDRLMRRGILTGYLHASNHPAIVRLLLQQLTTIIPLMGIHATKHLPHILPMITTTLTDPFGAVSPKNLCAALKTLQVLLLNTWPRMSDVGHRIEIVKALVLCWGTLGSEEMKGEGSEGIDGLEETRKEIKVAGRMLVKAGGAVPGVDLEAEIAPLVKAEPSLGELFGFDASL